MERWYSLNAYLQTIFGEKVYKLALDGGMTCPNRDGTLGIGGCIFCSAGGSGEFAEDLQPEGGVTAQIERAKERIRQKTDARRFIAYFQSYTNTYAPALYLRQLFSEAVSHPDVAVLSVATRPDCLPPEVISLLAELNHIKPVWVELGLQTMHEETAGRIRRGYPLSCFADAVQKLRAAGLEIIVHVILGLPGETKADILETIRYLARQDVQGVKLQLLHVLDGTELAEEYRNGRVKVLTLEEYLDILFACLELLPPDMVIHRLTGDGDKKLLLAPSWSGDKKLVLNTLRREAEARDIQQGRLYR